MREYLEDRDASESEEESDSGEATIDYLSDYDDEDDSEEEDEDCEEEGGEQDGGEETDTETENEVVADESHEEEEYEETSAKPKNKMNKKPSLYRIATPPPSPLSLGLSQSISEMLPRLRNCPLPWLKPRCFEFMSKNAFLQFRTWVNEIT